MESMVVKASFVASIKGVMSSSLRDEDIGIICSRVYP
jgi:hypothetical protein